MKRIAKLLVVAALAVAGGMVTASPAQAWPEGCSVYEGSHRYEVRASCTGGYGWVLVTADCMRVKAGQITEWTVYGQWAYVEFGEESIAECVSANRPPQADYILADD